MIGKFAPALAGIALLVAPAVASAHLQNDNLRARITFVGAHAVSASPGTVLAQRFAVKVEDVEGRPVPGLTVWFFRNGMAYPAQQGGAAPASVGAFVGPDDPLGVLTDADGVATAPPYRVGASEEVVAGVYGLGSAFNRDRIGFPPLVAFYHVNQPAVVEPPEAPWPPVANGVAEPVTLPWGSRAGMLLLAVLLLGMSLRAVTQRR
ncbi:hypothetical protein ACQQ2N_00315 [Dokdonella sp. MW10]|uniref:hypothetical protein n=1 Tax=Dokdonella sp. MW10 TaxID=2992926 RepID=UPI003F8041DE